MATTQTKATDEQIRFWGHVEGCLMWQDRINCTCGAAKPIAEHADVEPHLRTEKEKRELFPRMEILSDKLCQTHGFIFAALKEAGLTVVPLYPKAREIAPTET